METLVVQIFRAPRRFAAAARPAFRFCRSGLTSPLLVVRPPPAPPGAAAGFLGTQVASEYIFELVADLKLQ